MSSSADDDDDDNAPVRPRHYVSLAELEGRDAATKKANEDLVQRELELLRARVRELEQLVEDLRAQLTARLRNP